MSKILIATNRLVTGGPSIHLLYLLEYFQNKHDITLVFGQADKNEETMISQFEQLNIKTIQVKSLKKNINFFNDFIFGVKFAKIIKEINPDIIHTHTYKPGIIGRFVTNKKNVKKLIHTYHGLLFEIYFSKFLSNFFIKIDRYLAKKTDVIIALSELQKNDLVKHKITTGEKIEVIPIVIKNKRSDFTTELAQIFKNTWNIPKDTLVIGQIGRVVEVKNIKLTIETFKKIITRKNISIKLFIVGDGNLKPELINLAKSLNLKIATTKENSNEADIVFTSWINDLPPLYSALDLVVLTSKSEGTPLSIIEAQTSGTAVLAPSVGGIPDIIIDKETGLLFSTDSEFETNFEYLISNKLELIKMGEKAAIFAEKMFDAEKMFNQHKKIYTI